MEQKEVLKNSYGREKPLHHKVVKVWKLGGKI